MKKFLMVTLCLGLSAFATEGLDESMEIDYSELMSAQELTIDMNESDFESESAEFYESDLNESVAPGPRPRRRHRRGGWHPHPRPSYQVVCVARNGRGMPFRAFGRRPYLVQEAAMRACERSSYRPRSCRPMGCRTARGW